MHIFLTESIPVRRKQQLPVISVCFRPWGTVMSNRRSTSSGRGLHSHDSSSNGTPEVGVGKRGSSPSSANPSMEHECAVCASRSWDRYGGHRVLISGQIEKKKTYKTPCDSHTLIFRHVKPRVINCEMEIFRVPEELLQFVDATFPFSTNTHPVPNN